MSFVDHLRLSVRDVAVSRAFYDPWLRALGFAPVARHDAGAGWGKPDPGGRMQWLILTPATRPGVHDLLAPGLHHVAFDAGSRQTVDAVGHVLAGLGAEVLRACASTTANPIATRSSSWTRTGSSSR